MITKEKILLFIKYQGSLDDGSRWGSAKERRMMSGAEWGVLSSYCQDIHLVLNGLAAAEYAEKLGTELKRDFEDEQTIIYLKKLISENGRQ